MENEEQYSLLRFLFSLRVQKTFVCTRIIPVTDSVLPNRISLTMFKRSFFDLSFYVVGTWWVRLLRSGYASRRITSSTVLHKAKN